MPDLSTILDNRRELLTESVSDIVNTLNAKTVIKRNNELLTFRALTVKFGVDFATNILGRFKMASDANPLLAATYTAICTTGIDFGAPVTQGMIDQLISAGVFDQDMGNTIKSVGVWRISVVEDVYGEGVEATESDVTHAIEEINRKDLLTRVRQKASQVAGQVQNGSITSWEDAVTAFSID